MKFPSLFTVFYFKLNYIFRVHPNHTDIVVEFIMTQTYDLGVY